MRWIMDMVKAYRDELVMVGWMLVASMLCGGLYLLLR